MHDFAALLSAKRFYSQDLRYNGELLSDITDSQSKENYRFHLTMQSESDRGRIINSAAVRRLQQKTQVFPLEKNAAVRSRLTHSLEVMQVGRYITRKLLSEIAKHKVLRGYQSVGLDQIIESLVEMSCLMHDIGNPPFGHFGEKAISDWFTVNLDTLIEDALVSKGHERLPAELLDDLSQFEGNAQGIRLITSLQKLNLTQTQLATVLKYTRCGTEKKPAKTHPLFYLQKKVGYYYSEKVLVDEIYATHKLAQGHRHPLTYIMEAADDISYCIADLEDAIDKNILTIPQLCRLLEQEFDSKHPINNSVLEKALNNHKSWYAYKEDSSDYSLFFIGLRTFFINCMVNHAVRKFIANFDDIMTGKFSEHMLEDDSQEWAMAESMKKVAFKYVFNHREVEANELKGYTVITGLLGIYKPLLDVPEDIFSASLQGEKSAPLLLTRLCKKLPSKHVRAYKQAIATQYPTLPLFESNHNKEFYFRCRLIQAFISGMTDQFALDEYRELMAIN